MLFGLYLLFMAFLTTSLVLAARDGNPRQYNTPLNRFRIFCEVVTLLFVFYDLALENYELGSVMLVLLMLIVCQFYHRTVVPTTLYRYRSLKQNSVCVCIRTHEQGTVENENDKEKVPKKERIRIVKKRRRMTRRMTRMGKMMTVKVLLSQRNPEATHTCKCESFVYPHNNLAFTLLDHFWMDILDKLG